MSSDDERLSMGGGVSRALNARSGYVLEAEARKYAHVRHGGVVVTSAGALRARFVFHAVTIEYQPRATLVPSRDIVLQILRGCFYHADTLGLRSLAFPLLGTGAAGLSESTCLDTMVGYLIKTLLLGTHGVNHVEIVLHR